MLEVTLSQTAAQEISVDAAGWHFHIYILTRKETGFLLRFFCLLVKLFCAVQHCEVMGCSDSCTNKGVKC